uniref:Uncharacterized protein n=1 Tax=Sinocyclocheilus anshuiensis TaxID=1608454 RepID=A0A671SAJ2_9TELE
VISSLRDTSGALRFENKYINKIMKEYYQNLYSSECFCPEFYKKMGKEIVGSLTEMFADSLKNGQLPPTLNLANISLILKKIFVALIDLNWV